MTFSGADCRSGAKPATTVTQSYSLSLTYASLLRMYLPQTAPAALFYTSVTVVITVKQYTSVAAMKA